MSLYIKNCLYLHLIKNVDMKINPDLSVKEVVKTNFKTAALFQANNIDYCCGGNKKIRDACDEAGVDHDLLIGQLENIVSDSDPDSEFINSLSLTALADYVVQRHHSYVHRMIPVLRKNLDKICQVHGDRHPELYKIKDLFYVSGGDLTMHMQKEEIMLFPYIKRMEAALRQHSVHSAGKFGPVSNPIHVMMAEHQKEGDRFDEISRLSQGYQIPDDACMTYQVTFRQLEEFENDLHRHIHLENNILFPKAIEMES